MILPDGRDLRPGKVLCIGRNYVAHVIEMGGREGDQPVVFLKPSSALIADGDDIMSAAPERLRAGFRHKDLQLAMSVGKRGHYRLDKILPRHFDETAHRAGVPVEARHRAARELLAAAPEGFTKVFFTLGGSDANENALKIARLFTGRYKTITRYRSYHGASMGAASLSGDWRRAAVEPGLPGAIHVMDLDEGVPGTQIPRVLELEENVGAVFLEPVVGANGVLIPPAGYFQEVREACDRHGALLVCDEVLTGFGRCGSFFAFERFDAQPDLITCGKAITAGYGTLGAVLVHDRVARFFEDEELVCGLTHYAHPLGVAAALESIRVYRDEGLVANALALEAPLLRLLETLPGTGARALGLLGAVAFVRWVPRFVPRSGRAD